jgi:hypothetical protein
MDQNAMGLGASMAGRPPRREFVATIGTEELGRYAGVGLTLDRVIEEELRKVGCAEASAGPVDASDDVVIWEQNKVVAIVRVGPDGRPVVTRFDMKSLTRPKGAGTGDASCGAILAGPFYLVLPGGVRGKLVVVDIENMPRLDPSRGTVPAVPAGPFPPKKQRLRRGTLSRRPGPRRKPGWGHR